ncbi:MAG: amidophosphoribosyltransferase [Methanobacteriota archaeon]|nr:MAG: amidophosphoribosyltransferase [Euryarchaeota archaeon]
MGLKESCAVVGVYSPNREYQVSKHIYNALFSQQHRGQESAGIASFDGEELLIHKDMGLVPQVFDDNTLSKLLGYVGIGHVRYSTTGESNILNAQPFKIGTGKHGFALAYNGNLTNYDELRNRLEQRGHIFVSDSDTEVIAHILNLELRRTNSFVEAFRVVMSELEGAYSLVVLTSRGDLFAVRDPYGIRPLSFGRSDNVYVVASESIAIDVLGGSLIRDVKPGEVIHLGDSGVQTYQLVEKRNYAHCMFEYVYFARPDSMINGVYVYDVRIKIGEQLAKEHPVEADNVVPVPDTSRAAAVGYSKVSGIPTIEGLMKNRYVGRTFIMPTQREREASTRIKLNPIRSALEGKRIVLLDDSIVRGTTMRNIVSMLRKAGAKEVHVRIGCPPIKFPCKLGIDMPTRQELIASTLTVEEICSKIGADSLGYLSIDGLIKSIGLKREDLCLGCLTGVYPVPTQETLEEYF